MIQHHPEYGANMFLALFQIPEMDLHSKSCVAPCLTEHVLYALQAQVKVKVTQE